MNEEYREAFRTKSYIEICNKAQGQLGKTSTKIPSSSTPSSSVPLCTTHLTEFLLEPRQEIITNMKVHRLVVDYFEASLEACRCCDTILEAIQSTRQAYRSLTRVVKLSKGAHLDCKAQKNDDHDIDIDIYKEIASFALQNNPLSNVVSAVQFREIRDGHMALMHRLILKRGRIRRRLTVKRVGKNVGGIVLVTSHGVVLIILLVFCFHSVVGLVVAPSIVCGLVGLFMKRISKARGNNEKVITTRSSDSNSDERLCEQLDVAAKGVYIVINDLDTMSRMVKRLHDEVEHRKTVAGVCVRNNGKWEILKRVVCEFRDRESSFLEQLGELEEHVYLCFLTINRSRRLVMQEITDTKL